MSTPCTVRFTYAGAEDDGSPFIYLHWDGEPGTTGKAIQRFLADSAQLRDSRLDDPTMLAARFVAYLGWSFQKWDAAINHPASPINFTGIRLYDSTALLDVDYRYTIYLSSAAAPSIECVTVSTGESETLTLNPQE